MGSASPAELVRRLIAVPSPQTDLFEAEPQVLDLVDEAARIADELGLESSRDSMGNLAIRVGQAGHPNRALLMGYAMTHPGGRMVDPFVPKDITGPNGEPMIRGRGTSEPKGALAAALAAMANLRGRQLDGEVVLAVSTAGETGRHDAARAFLDAFGSPKFAWAVILVGTNLELCVANKGRQDMDVVVRGRAGHSSMPWAALNAIEGAVEAMERVKRIELAGEHPGLGRATVAVTKIRSWPDATHTIQDEVVFTLDRRLLPGHDPEAALRDVREAIGDLAPFEVEVKAGPFMYPSDIPLDGPLANQFRNAYGDAGLTFPPVRYSHGALDAGYFNHHGTPAVMFGPGDQAQWHTNDEAVSIRDLDACARILESLALQQVPEVRS